MQIFFICLVVVVCAQALLATLEDFWFYTNYIYIVFIRAAWMECIRWMTSNFTVYKYPHLLSFDTLSNGFICFQKECRWSDCCCCCISIVGVQMHLFQVPQMIQRKSILLERKLQQERYNVFRYCMDADSNERIFDNFSRSTQWHCVIYYEHISFTLNI